MRIRRDDIMRMDAANRGRVFLFPLDIGSPSPAMTANWAAVLGATKAEVDEASVTLAASSVIETHTDVPFTAQNSGWAIDIPPGKRLSALTLQGFKQPDQNEIVSSPPANMRITLAFPMQQGQGYESPRFAVPPLNAQSPVPQPLRGASLHNHVLSLDTPVAASKVLLSLVTGDNPSQFGSQQTKLDRVDVTTDTPPTNAKLTAPGGTAVWQTPLFDPAGPEATVDLRAPLEAALSQQLAKNQSLQATFMLSADAPAQVYLTASGPRGTLLRAEKGVIRTALEGDPAVLQLSGPLADELPATVTGDLTVRYTGIRILETASDVLPGRGSIIRGTIVGKDGAVRTLPAQALDQQKPAKVSVYGRAPEDCELSIEFVRMAGAGTGEILAAPAVVQLKKSDTLSSVWAPVPKGTQIAGSAAVRVRANRGRFFWVNNESGQGIVRIAIFDPDPGGRALDISGAHLLNFSANRVDQPAFSFPADCFHGAAPVFTSNLFLAVECGDLTLRYAR